MIKLDPMHTFPTRAIIRPMYLSSMTVAGAAPRTLSRKGKGRTRPG